MKLDELDERFVPRMAVRLRRFLDAAAERRSRAVDGARELAAGVLAPSATSPLRRLDDRYAARGPLALLRDVPQLGLLLIAAVFVAGSGIALERSGQRNAASKESSPDALIPTSLGPDPGTKVAAYIAATRKRAVLLSTGSPDGVYTALVSFTSYQTAEQARRLLGDLHVTRVLAHVQLPAAEVLPIPVTSALVEDVGVTFAEISKRKLRDRQEFVNLATSITGTTKEEVQFKAFYTEAARTAAKEAAAYGKSCACLFAALVRGKARDLAALPSLPAVRAVDIGAGEPDTLQIKPLLPEHKVTVMKPIQPTQNNGA
ncbi:MAG: hypothetical protein JJD92_15230 [Frankiaceae bacterium]|nr:hypothetical protein [Frankiaceae bacterium]